MNYLSGNRFQKGNLSGNRFRKPRGCVEPFRKPSRKEPFREPFPGTVSGKEPFGDVWSLSGKGAGVGIGMLKGDSTI